MMPYNQSGSYLVRNSVTSPGDYALSVRDEAKVWHYRIQQSEDGEFFIKKVESFMTIIDLVTYYQHQAHGLHSKLIQPCIYGKCSGSDKWEVDPSIIRPLNKLTEGEFGEVWDSSWNRTFLVTVKTYKQEHMTLPDFLQMVSLLKKLHHKRLVQFYAVCTIEEPIFIVTEYMKHGNLLEYLRKKKRLKNNVPLFQLIEMSLQVAEGMAYLEEQNCIHRDLAAENILVGENLMCKVANFEMAQVMDEDIYKAHSKIVNTYKLKWTAPETVTQNRCSIKSDVWSFGIVLYEIITYGRLPYPGMTSTEVFEQVQHGYRMPQPKECPKSLYDIMLDCWEAVPENRPTFSTLQWHLTTLCLKPEPIFADPAELLPWRVRTSRTKVLALALEHKSA